MTDQRTPGGVNFERTAYGFRIRAVCRSFADTFLLLGRAAVISSLPFVLWWDLIRNIWYEEGPGFWLAIGFLGLWAAVIAYVDFIALISLAGEVRITKDNDQGKVFTGIGAFGWTHSLTWSDFSGVSVVAQERSRTSFRSRGIELKGTSRRYKFGWLLPDERGAVVAALLNEHVFSDY